MIYPVRKKKVRSFASGGGTASLFDNPGTYLGIQYVPTKQELPDVEGLQFLVQMEHAKMANASKAKDEAGKAAAERMKVAGDLIKDKDWLTGEGTAFLSNTQEKMDSWYSRYNTVDSMNSTEAIQEMTRLQNDIARGTLALNNNKKVLDQKETDAVKVKSNTYVNQGHFMLPVEDSSQSPLHVPIDEYYREKDGKYKGQSPMTVNDLFNWRRNYSGFTLSDSFDVRQYDSETTRKYIDDSFKSFATNSSSIQGGEQLSFMLKEAGIDPANLDITEFKMKIKNGEINADNLFRIFSKNLDSQARDSMMASLTENGINPYAVTRKEKDSEGKEFEVTAFDDYVYEMYMGEKSKKLGTDTEIAIEDETMAASKKDGGAGGADSSVVTGLITRGAAIDIYAKNNNLSPSDIYPTSAFNPILGKKQQNVPTLKLSNLDPKDYDAIMGATKNFNPITDDQIVYANGHAITIGQEWNDGATSTGAAFYWTPQTGNVLVRDIETDQLDPTTGLPTAANMTTMIRRIWVNEAGLAQFKDKDGNPVTSETAKMQPNVRKMDEAQIKITMKREGIDIESASEMFKISDFDGWGAGDGLFEVAVEVPVGDLTVLGGTEDKAAQGVLNNRKSRENRILSDMQNAGDMQGQWQNMMNGLFKLK